LLTEEMEETRGEETKNEEENERVATEEREQTIEELKI
jgi:hypothetical protein